MFETLEMAPGDKILGLIKLFEADPRDDKVDLGVGVYRDENGRTPVMQAVRAAELELHKSQASKSYLGLTGHAGFNDEIARLVLGDRLVSARVRTVQTPGGSGALRLLGELLVFSNPDLAVWTSDPSWANHVPMLQAVRAGIRTYPYFDASTGGVRFDAMTEALSGARPGDAVLLHGCCHNPTGANLTPGQWETVADLVTDRGLLPFVDIAYQGFGDGLDEDAFGVRTLAGRVPEMVVAVSCSKNFAVYRDRVGAALVMGANSGDADRAFSQLLGQARRMYSMPPDHGAAAVHGVLAHAGLRRQWRDELETMRTRMLQLRTDFAAALRRHSNSGRFDFLAEHRGMFSRLGLTAGQVETLRERHGIYMVGDSRINVAGLPDDGLDRVAAAIVQGLDDGTPGAS